MLWCIFDSVPWFKGYIVLRRNSKSAYGMIGKEILSRIGVRLEIVLVLYRKQLMNVTVSGWCLFVTCAIVLLEWFATQW